MSGRVLSLFDRTGQWAQPYRESGAVVECLDLTRGEDVRLLEAPREPADVILAAPPCTHFAVSGARWWKQKGMDALLEGLALVDATFRVIAVHRPAVWAIENPVGRLRHYLGAPRLRFDPCDYAGWADNPDAEAYTKRTCLWGDFKVPDPKPVEPVLGSKMHLLPPSKNRGALRSVTPQGFARAFSAANPIAPSSPGAQP